MGSIENSYVQLQDRPRVNSMLIFTVILLFVLGGVAIWQFVLTRHFINIGEKLAAKATAFSRKSENAKLHILFVGDSSGVGTGTSSPLTSIAGLVGKRYPEAEILNMSINGARTKDVISQLKNTAGKYDLIMIHVGGNDNVRFTNYDQLAKDIRQALDLALSKSNQVLLTTTGNVGTAKLLPASSRWIFEQRSRRIRTIFMQQVAASQGNIRYTDLFRERSDDPFARDPQKYYAADMFHPSDAGYLDWFTLMEKELNNFSL